MISELKRSSELNPIESYSTTQIDQGTKSFPQLITTISKIIDMTESRIAPIPTCDNWKSASSLKYLTYLPLLEFHKELLHQQNKDP